MSEAPAGDAYLEEPLPVRLRMTPWNDRILGGKTAHASLDVDAYEADLSRRAPWLADALADDDFVYVSASADAGDIRGKAALSHLGFDFVYQTTECVLRLFPDMRLASEIAGFIPVDPSTVSAEEVADVCMATLKHGRFCEDWLTHAQAGPRNAQFIRDLHKREDVRRFFTRSPDGQLNGYAYVPIERGLANLLLMGISAAAAPAGGGGAFWELALADLRDSGAARRVWTRVPSANLGVLNIYAKLGFSFMRASYDYRMFPQCVASRASGVY